MEINCGQCALLQPESQLCRLHNWTIKDLKDTCPQATRTLEKCDICGSEMLPSQAIINMGADHKTHLICPQCNAKYHTCSVCGQADKCDFETNPIDLPKQVRKQIQTPQGYIVTDIPNPERIREICEKGCDCYDKEFGCCKQNNWCSHHSVKWQK